MIWLDSSGVNQMLIDNVRYLNDQATALNGILRSTNTIANSRIQNVNGVGTFCLDWGFGFATFSRSVIRDCSILKKAGTEQTSLHNLAGIASVAPAAFIPGSKGARSRTSPVPECT